MNYWCFTTTPVTAIQRTRLGTTNAVENNDVTKIYSLRKWFILAIFLTFLDGYFAQLQDSGITFYRYSCREICLWQRKLKKKKKKKKKKTTFFLLSSVFSPTPAYFGQYFLTVIYLLCKCFCILYIVLTLEPSLMHFFEPQVVSLSTETGNGSRLDFILGYNLPRVTIYHNAVNQHSLGTTNTDYNLHALRQNSLIRLRSPDKWCCFKIPNDLFDCYILSNAFLILIIMTSVHMHGIVSDYNGVVFGIRPWAARVKIQWNNISTKLFCSGGRAHCLGNKMCFLNIALTFDSWNNKLFTKTRILNQMYISIFYMYMYMGRLFCMPHTNFIGPSDCSLYVWAQLFKASLA